MRRVLLSPRWWGGSLLVAGTFVLFVFLGRWQWDRGQSPTGSIQNLLYALQWWSFALLGLGLWVRTLHDEAKGRPHRGSTATRSAPAGPVEVLDEEEDRELIAYNAYLAWLNAHPRS